MGETILSSFPQWRFRRRAFPFDLSANKKQAHVNVAMSESNSSFAPDYAQLKKLLTEKNWKLADDETRLLMCRVAGRDAVPHLTPEAVNIFPCEVLRTIDVLWSTSSLGNFGFSAQRSIWLEVGGTSTVYDFQQMGRSGREALGNVEHRFAARVGWHNSGDWSGYSALHAKNLLPGHLPYSCLMCSYGSGLIGLLASALAWRIQVCSAPSA
jgi:hypothetical protein